MEIAWTVVGILVPLLLGFAVGFVSAAPAEFRAAKWCFWLSAIVLGGMDVSWQITTDKPIAVRIAVGIAIWSLIGVGLPEAIRWVNRRERGAVATTTPPPQSPSEVSPSESAQLMVSKIALIPPTNPEQKATLEIFLDNRGKLAAQEWVVNRATAVLRRPQTLEEQQGGVAAARIPLLGPGERSDIQPGDTNVLFRADEPNVTTILRRPFYYYVYVCVVYRDQAHKKQHWVTEYGAVAANGFDVWNPAGNRRIFLENDGEIGPARSQSSQSNYTPETSQAESVTPENVEASVRSWMKNYNFKVDEIRDPQTYFAVGVIRADGNRISVARRKDREKYITLQGALVPTKQFNQLIPDFQAVVGKLSSDQLDELRNELISVLVKAQIDWKAITPLPLGIVAMEKPIPISGITEYLFIREMTGLDSVMVDYANTFRMTVNRMKKTTL